MKNVESRKNKFGTTPNFSKPIRYVFYTGQSTGRDKNYAVILSPKQF